MPATKIFRFRTEAERDAFAGGVDWVNDSAIEFVDIGTSTHSASTHPWWVKYIDNDQTPEDNVDKEVN